MLLQEPSLSRRSLLSSQRHRWIWNRVLDMLRVCSSMVAYLGKLLLCLFIFDCHLEPHPKIHLQDTNQRHPLHLEIGWKYSNNALPIWSFCGKLWAYFFTCSYYAELCSNNRPRIVPNLECCWYLSRPIQCILVYWHRHYGCSFNASWNDLALYRVPLWFSPTLPEISNRSKTHMS